MQLDSASDCLTACCCLSCGLCQEARGGRISERSDPTPVILLKILCCLEPVTSTGPLQLRDHRAGCNLSAYLNVGRVFQPCAGTYLTTMMFAGSDATMGGAMNMSTAHAQTMTH